MKVVEVEPQVRTGAEEAARLRIPGRPGAWRRYEPFVIGGVAVALVLAAWQAVAAAQFVPSLFLPGPYDIAGSTWRPAAWSWAPASRWRSWPGCPSAS